MLVDTSIWVEHFRRRSATLIELLEAMEVWTHPFVVGELACGNLHRRAEILRLLGTLPNAPLAEHEEVLAFIDTHRLSGRGLGWVDIHLLAAARLSKLPLWTLDRRLAAAARELGLGVNP